MPLASRIEQTAGATSPHILAILGLVALMFVGAFQDEFLFAQEQQQVRTWLKLASGVLAIGVLFAAEWRRAKTLGTPQETVASRLQFSWLSLLQLLVVYGLLSYVVMQKLAPRVLHELARPQPGTLAQPVRVALGGGRGCKRIAYFDRHGSTLSGRLCRLSESEYEALRAGAPIELHGTASRFGFLVRGHRALPIDAASTGESP
ncbi:hypothetical protein [Lysobacter silvisoli]|uniref:Uncharacterized protein n=1 Tax=Lysobacter silvisoli TaxID=2293254 RepID=A0A371K0T4_9GAMM|nr:hypothetical protein [Lysobacter silvisoli]RDZ27515.1 hypothetical protein DX914_14940 [Lysobacter silvisoli]